VLARGEGATVWDSEGRAFTDFTMGWGSVLLGHAHPAIVEAVKSQAGRGSNFAYVTEPALALAEEIIRAVACAERVRFCASGTEATSYAVRLARAYTGRPKVLKFEGAYHGANDVGTVSLFPQRLLDFPLGEPTSAGLGPGAAADVLVAPYNDLRTTTAILEAHRHELAGIIVEPLHRCTSPQPGFLQGLREVTSELGLVLIFDETVTGFRLAYGGAQEYYGVRPIWPPWARPWAAAIPSERWQVAPTSWISSGRIAWAIPAMSGSPPASAGTRSPPRRPAQRWASCRGPPRIRGFSTWESASAPG
jgi:glutamate-1-semialdehyde 2,1-aminomutase